MIKGIKMEPDKAICDEKDDLLNRSNFAKKLANCIQRYTDNDPITMAILGKWGSGKTSLINLILNNLSNDDYVVIHFNPWFFSNLNNLYFQFFKLLISEIKQKEIENRNIVEKIKIHDNSIFIRSEIEKLEDYFRFIELNSSNFTNSLDSNQLESFESLKFHKDKCDEYFFDLDFKILVVIDDIDRLIDSEIEKIFILVKSLADFPNFIYLLSFDKEIISKSLNNFHSEKGDKFLDKIIQIPIQIPKISESKLDELILANLTIIYNNYFKDNFINTNELRDVSNYLKIFIKDIRDLKRYINILNIYLDIFSDELNINDFFLILAIQLFEYEVFLKIIEYKDILVMNSSIFVMSPDVIKNNLSKIIKDFKEKSNSNYNDLNNVFIYLFPILRIVDSKFSFNQDNEKWDIQRRICSEKHFDKYFTLSLENNEVSVILLEKLAKLDDLDEICEILTQKSNLDYNHSLLNQFSKLTSEIPKENLNLFIKAFMKCGDEMELYSISRRYLNWILDDLFEKIESKEVCYNILVECINYEDNILICLEYIYSLAFDYGLAGSNNNIKSEEDMCVSLNQTKQLIVLTLHKVHDYCKDSFNFLNHDFLQDLLTYWELLEDKDIVKKYVLNHVKSDEEILFFLKEFQTIFRSKSSITGGNSKQEMFFDFNKLDTYHGLNFYENKLNGILRDGNLAPDIKSFCQLFLIQLEEYRNKSNNFIN